MTKRTTTLTAIALIFALTTPIAQASTVSPFAYIDIASQPSGQVLGTSTSNTSTTQISTSYSTTCKASTLNTTRQGFFGRYYNMSETDPGMKQNTTSYNKQLKIGGENYWYQAEYWAFDRVDASINFGKDFYPVNTGKAGDPNNFGVHWRAAAYVPKDGKYTFTVQSDDDSWLLIDNSLVLNNGGGATSARRNKKTVTLTAGYHQFDIYFAQRGVSGSFFSFTFDDQLVTFHPLTAGCTVQNLTTHTGGDNTPTTGSVNSGNGRVLGTSANAYTQPIALYKATDNPAVYAIYANGYRHYITNPTAFHNYGYSFADVQTVSRIKLDSYPDVRLVRTPDDTTIYFLYTRADRQWLKLPIPSTTAFVSYTNNHWGNLIVIDQIDRDAYPDATLISADKGATVYLLDNGVKRKFTSREVLLRHNYNPAEIVRVSEAHLDAYKTGLVIE